MKFIVTNPDGKSKIDGNIYLQGAKNSMLNNLLLPMLTEEEFIISNVPKIKDIEVNLEFLKILNARVEWIDDHTVLIQCNNIKYNELSATTSAKTTGSKYFIPFMVFRFGEFIMGPSGGDKLGNRGFENYANFLKSFGIDYKLENGLYYFYKTDTKINEVTLPFQSLGLTINSIFASLHNSSDTIIRNACIEAEIDNTIEIINRMGGDVKRKTPHEIIVRGNKKYHGGKFRNMSDRNVAVTYSIMALISNSRIEILNYDNKKMDAFYKFLNDIGAKYKIIDNNKLVIEKSDLSNSFNPIRIKAFIYPDIHSDWQPLIAPLLTQINGNSYIEEHLFPDRLKYWNELEKMGAKYKFDYTNKTRFEKDENPHAVCVFGKLNLNGAEVTALDLRGGVALIIASLIAIGTTTIHNADEILRGYENIDVILKRLSLDIKREG